jgi:hypothetical protein
LISEAQDIPVWNLAWKHIILPREGFQPSFGCNSVMQNEFISLWILHQSCIPGHVNEFGLLNRSISISKAQDIPVWISSVESRDSWPREEFLPKFAGLIRRIFLDQGLNRKVLKWGIELKKDIESWRGGLDHHKWQDFYHTE